MVNASKYWVTIAVLLTCACGKKKQEEEPAPAPAPKPREVAKADDACSARVDAITKRIAPFQRGIRMLSPAPAKVEVPTAAARPLDARGPIVVSERNTLEIAGERLGSVDALGERLTRDKRAAVIAAEGNPDAMPIVYFQVDGSLPVAALVKLAGKTPTGVAPRLLVTRPGEAESYDADATTPASVRALLHGLKEKTEPAQRAVFLAQAMEKAIGGCAPLVRLFGSIASMPAEDKQRALVTGFAPALRECECQGVDMDIMEVFLLEMSDAFREPQGWLPLGFDPAAKRKLRLPATANTHDLAAALEKLPPAALDAPIALVLEK